MFTEGIKDGPKGNFQHQKVWNAASWPSSYTFFNFNPLILTMYLLGITSDTWHYIKIQVELFSYRSVKAWSLSQKGAGGRHWSQNILGFMGIFLGAGICSVVFCLMSLCNQTITVHRYSCSLCWVHFHLVLYALKHALRDFAVVSFQMHFPPRCIRLDSVFPEDFL